MWALAERAHHGGPSISDKLGCAAAIADLYPHCSVVLLLLECLQDVCDELYGVLWEVFASCVEAPLIEVHYTFDLYGLSLSEHFAWEFLWSYYIVGGTIHCMLRETFVAWVRAGVCYLGLWDSCAVHDLFNILAVRCYRVFDTASWKIGTGAYETPCCGCRVSFYA